MDDLTKERKASNFVRAWFWLSQITSIVGLASIIEDLRLWKRIFAAVVEFLRINLPFIGDLLQWLATLVHGAVQIFRSVFHPLLDTLLKWLAVDATNLEKDVVVVFFFVLISSSRIKKIHERFKSNRYAETTNMLTLRARDFGLNVKEEDKYKIVSAFFSWKGLSYRHDTESIIAGWRFDYRKQWADLMFLFGPALEEFVRLNMEAFEAESAKERRLSASETRWLHAMYILSGCTAAFIAVDYLAYS